MKVTTKQWFDLGGTFLATLAAAAVSLSGCAGELDQNNYPTAGAGGSVGGGGASTTGGTPSVGGGGTPAGGSTGMVPPLDGCVTQAFASCTMTCHNTQFAAFFGNLDLSTADIGMKLADKPANNRTAPCAADGKVIDTANPANSVLLQRLKGTQPSMCGTVMPPPPATAMPAADLACVEAWINKF